MKPSVIYQVQVCGSPSIGRWIPCDNIVDEMDPVPGFTNLKRARKYKRLREAPKRGGNFQIVKITKEVVK